MAESEGPHRGLAPPADGMSAVRVAFPRVEADFEADIRVSFDMANKKWILEEDDGREFEWVADTQRWIESTDEALLEQQRSAYKVEGVDESAPAMDLKKRKRGRQTSADPSGAKKPKKQPVERANTSVYVTGLPHDTNVEEINDLFKRQGILADYVDSGQPKIKMYNNDQGEFNGEALITYFRPESVEMAILLMDKTDFRKGGPGNMIVQVADMSYKKTRQQPDQNQDQPEKSKPRRDVAKIKALTNEKNRKLAEWDDDDPQELPSEIKPLNKWAKCVLVKHFFTPEETEEPGFAAEVDEDLREKAIEDGWGTVTKVVVYDREPAGIVMLRFTDADSAERAMNGMHGRLYDGRQLEAWIPDRKPQYKQSFRDDDEEAARLEAYGRDIAAEGADDGDGAMDGK